MNTCICASSQLLGLSESNSRISEALKNISGKCMEKAQ